jgi:HD superfamily phosphohydrolase
MRAPALRFARYLPDVVWGEIPITEEEDAILRSDFVLRLKEFRQMGVASTTFHGARHDRFQHSLGVMHAADQMLWIVNVVLDDGSERFLGELDGFDARHRKAVRMAGLLHDLGHPPLSHLVEELFRKYPDLLTVGDSDEGRYAHFLRAVGDGVYSHEGATGYLLNSPGMKEVLRHYFSDDDMAQIAGLVHGRADAEIFQLLNCLIDSDVDADKIDYLLRDAYYCGALPGFSLLQFRGKLKILSSGDPQRIYVEPDAINAVNSLLWARYRTIDELHYERRHRIATQLVIDKLQTALHTCSDQKRINTVGEMHLDPEYSDTRLEEFLKAQGISLSGIRRGVVDYDECATLDFWDFDPIARAALYTIVSQPPSIVQLQELVRKSLKDGSVIVDVRTGKPTKMLLKVYNPAANNPTIFDLSGAAEGMLIDSMTMLKVHLYLPKGKVVDVCYSEIRDAAVTTGMDWSARNCCNGALLGPDLILIIMWAVRGATVQLFDPERPEWIYAQTYLQRFVGQLCQRLGVGCSYDLDELQRDEVDADFARDLTQLVVAGLVERRREPIFYEKKSAGSLVRLTHRPRYDHRITYHGLAYCELLAESDRIRQVERTVSDAIKKLLKKQYKQLSEFMHLERDLRELRVDPDSGRIDEPRERRQEIRACLGDEFCLLVD